MKKVLSLIVFLTLGASAIAQTKWTVDPVHSTIGFLVRHLGISEVNGRFTRFEGSYTSSKADLGDIMINFNIDVSSVNTGEVKRDDDLKTEKYFNVEKYPSMKFESTSFKKIKGNDYHLIGRLTIRDVTKDVTFHVVYGGRANDPWGNTRSGFSATTVIDRFDFDIKAEPTGLIVGKDITLNLNLEFIKSK